MKNGREPRVKWRNQEATSGSDPMLAEAQLSVLRKQPEISVPVPPHPAAVRTREKRPDDGA